MEARSAASSSSIERFRLSGPSADLDPRYNAWRGDLADVTLAGKLFAPHYAEAVSRTIGASGATLHAGAAESEALAELAPGEEFALLDITGDWAWGYRPGDHLVGYVRAEALAD